MNNKKVIQIIRQRLESYIKKNNLESLVLGISGGIDSALIAAIAKPVCDKLEIPLIGRSIPISTNTNDEIDRANHIGNSFCTDFDEINTLTTLFPLFRNNLALEGSGGDHKDKIRQGNLKARMRMIYLYDLAQLHNGMVLSTDNYTEYLLGFWTLNGDVGSWGGIQNLWKTEVYDLSDYLVSDELTDEDQKLSLQSCIDCQATDGLGISRTDLDQIMPNFRGTSRNGYKKVDKILKEYKSGNKSKTITPVIQRHLKTKFKRLLPINIKRNILIK